MSAAVMKAMCPGCPFNYGDEATEMAYNLGCLPSIAEVATLCAGNATAWACHSSPACVCGGYAETFPERVALPLQHQDGVHRS